MSGYFDALISAAKGDGGTAHPLPRPPFAREDESGIVEAELINEAPRRRGRAAVSPAAPDLAAAKVMHSAGPEPADGRPATVEAATENPVEAVHVPPARTPPPVERSVTVREERLIQARQQEPPAPVLYAPVEPQPAPPTPPTHDRAVREVETEREIRIAEVVRIETADRPSPVDAPESRPPDLILAIPVSESISLPELPVPPDHPPPVQIEIAHIDIRIAPPDVASAPAPSPASREPEAMPLADYLAERSRAAG